MGWGREGEEGGEGVHEQGGREERGKNGVHDQEEGVGGGKGGEGKSVRERQVHDLRGGGARERGRGS